MSLRPAKSHVHAGKSSRGMLDAKRIMLGMGLTKGDVVLDAGCGTGFFSIEAGAIIKNNGTVYAIDSMPSALEFLRKDLASKNITYVRPILADMTRTIPLDTAAMDATMLVNVLHGLAANHEEAAALREIARVTRPGGLLGIVDFKKVSSPGPAADVRLSSDDVIAMVTPFGFNRRKQFEAGPWHYCVVFERI